MISSKLGCKLKHCTSVADKRGSGINTGRLPKRPAEPQVFRGFRWHAPPEIFFFNLTPPPGFLSHPDSKFTDRPNHFPDFNKESFVFY